MIGVVLLTSRDFQPDPLRLAFDTLVSLIFTIFAFAYLYRGLGISLTSCCTGAGSVSDHIYFSAVTFSTLGYGDFRPCPASRPWAALQAILGNLHLGLIVGSAFFAVQKRR